MRSRLYLARPLPTPVMTVIHEHFDLTVPPLDRSPTQAEIQAGIRESQAVICTLNERFDGDMLAAAPSLRVIANYAVGYNNIDVDAAKARGVIVTNTPDVLTNATADITWALILAVARRVVEGDQLVRQNQWTGWSPTQMLGVDLSGKTLGIIGMGRIGLAVARRAAGFEMTVLYWTRSGRPLQPANPAWQRVSFEELLRRSDFLSPHIPLTPDTHHLLNDAALRLMKPTAFLINAARGPVVDEAALVQALQEHRLAGAGLDVYEKEPELHPGLRELSQVVLLPHLGSATIETRIRMGMMCVENVLAVLEGKPVPNRVA
ncbi:MAG: D-glycerate dehydrogenase [Nitrospirae bacterium RIFCSPLOWO2_02_FULL_62_14]|nr:MAG: D-glycerate dehydrogenase [Nitrospirae bacterium RIFCSPLOWO2_02_FULL_62_14]